MIYVPLVSSLQGILYLFADASTRQALSSNQTFVIQKLF